MAEYGLLSGLAKGLNAGLDAYNSAQDRQAKIKQYQDELEMKKLLRDQQERQLQMEQTSKGLIAKEGGGFELSPEQMLQEKNKGLLLGAQAHKTSAEAQETMMKAKNPQSRQMTDPELKAATGLREEFNRRQNVKDFNTVNTAYKKVLEAEKNPSAAGDLSLIFSYNKILDPASTVREGEFANAQNAAGWSDQMRNLYNRALSGERLNPEQRADFARQAKAQAAAQAQALEEVEQEFGGLAQRYKVDPNLIFTPRAKALLEQKGPETKVIGGKTYKKVQGGWEEQ